MDSRDSPQSHHHHLHQQHQHHHHQQQQQQQIHHHHHHHQQQQQQQQQSQHQHQQHHHQQPFPHSLMSSYGLHSNSMSPNSGNMMHPLARFPSLNQVMASTAATNAKPFDSIINNNKNSNSHNSSMSNNNGLAYESGLAHQSSFSVEQQSGEKKKRGRPRKCATEGNIALGLSSGAPPNSTVGDDDFSPPVVSAPPSGGSPVKRGRGRPPGSGKKQLDALGPAGVGFTPHVIMCQPGEDIASKIVAFSRQGTRTVCILSANGAISSVTLKQPSSPSGTVTYEDRFQIISLSGSFALSESNNDRSRNVGLTISFAAKDDRVLGGSVAGALMAATPVQVIVASFAADVKKPYSNISASTPSSGATGQIVNFGGPVAAGAAASPSSNGGSNDSSDDNGSSPLDGAGYGQTYNGGIQPIHSIPYHAMPWHPNR